MTAELIIVPIYGIVLLTEKAKDQPEKIFLKNVLHLGEFEQVYIMKALKELNAFELT